MSSATDNNPEVSPFPIDIEFSSPSLALLITFGGIAGGIGMPPFEFFNLTRDLDAKKIYVRDPNQAWYQRGLPGMGDEINGVAAFLVKTIADAQVTRTVLIGNSMGGYAALVFGILLNAHTIHAFSPQTFIDRVNRFRYRDSRWRKEINATHKSPHQAYLDLRPLLKSSRASGQLHIHYSADDRWDKIHAERLRGLPNVVLHAYPEGGHGLVKHLRDTGALKTLLVRALSE